MNKNILGSLICLLLINLIGCKSVPIVTDLSIAREKLLKEEEFRYQLPIEEISPVEPIFPETQTYTLKNGLTIYVIEDHRLPIAHARLVFKNGAAFDPLGYSGLHSLAALMMKEGTRELSSVELSEAFANLGTEVAATTAKDFSQISVSMLSDKLEKALSLLSSMVKHPRMDSEDFKRIKFQQQNAIAANQADPSYAAQTSFLMAAYGAKHPYAYPNLGTLKTLEAIDIERVKRTHRESFGPNNAALVVVGDITMAALKKHAKRLFGDWKKINFKPLTIPNPPKKSLMDIRLVGRPHTPQTFVLIGKAAANAQDKDLPVFEILQQILAGIPTSRIDAKLREEKGWTYGASSISSPLRGLGPWLLTSSIQVPFGADAVGEILKVFDKLSKEMVNDDELKSAKDGSLESFSQRYTTIEKKANNLVGLFSNNLPRDYDRQYYERLKQVSKEDIMGLAKRLFDRKGLVTVAVGDREVMEVPLEKMKVGTITIEDEHK